MTVTATSVGASDPKPSPTTPSAGRKWRARLVPAGAAALAGLLLYISFPPRTLWWLALPAFAVLGRVLRGRSWKAGLGLGYLFGLGFLLPLLVWTGVEVGPGPWIALVVIEAVFVALVGAGITVVSRLPGWPVWAAALWIAGEAARARVPFSGFPGARSRSGRRTACSCRSPRSAALRSSDSPSYCAASVCTSWCGSPCGRGAPGPCTGPRRSPAC